MMFSRKKCSNGPRKKAGLNDSKGEGPNLHVSLPNRLESVIKRMKLNSKMSM